MDASVSSVLHIRQTSASVTADRPHRTSASWMSVNASRRRPLTVAFGLIWLLDAALQFQPYMFTSAFPHQVLGPAAEGNPSWVHDPVVWAAGLMSDHIVLLNAVFALVQLAIAIGLLWPRTAKLALAGSVAWSLLVWWLGEGLGGILTGPMSPLAGLPGAVLLYAVIAVLLWPRIPDEPARSAESVATRSVIGARGARAVWIVLWLGFAAEGLRAANRAPNALHDLVAGAADGEPRWIRSVDVWAADALSGRGLMVSTVLAACFVLIALSVLVPSLTRVGVMCAVVLSVVMWVVVQDFGAIATGRSTDPNSGLPLLLLALCYWPST